jgi:hypothetical protein
MCVEPNQTRGGAFPGSNDHHHASPHANSKGKEVTNYVRSIF